MIADCHYMIRNGNDLDFVGENGLQTINLFSGRSKDPNFQVMMTLEQRSITLQPMPFSRQLKNERND